MLGIYVSTHSPQKSGTMFGCELTVNANNGTLSSFFVRITPFMLFFALLINIFLPHVAGDGAWAYRIDQTSVLLHTSASAARWWLLRGGELRPLEPAGFRILEDTVLHDNWRKLVSRRVQLPSRRHADFEIVSQGDRQGRVTDEAVLVFVWNSQSQTATIIREYMPSVHKMMPGLAAGMVEDKHHDQDSSPDHRLGNDITDPMYTAAVHELEEECRLKGGNWYRLCEPTYMDKYSTTRLSVYLVVDPVPFQDADCKARDETEEGMEIVDGVTVEELEQVIASGGMTVVGGWATQLALSKLRSLKQLL